MGEYISLELFYFVSLTSSRSLIPRKQLIQTEENILPSTEHENNVTSF